MAEDPLGMGMAFAKHKRRIEDACQQKLEAAAKAHGLEVSKLKAQLASVETSADTTPMEYARLKEENETLKQKLVPTCGESRAREVLELLHATRERNELDQALRHNKQKSSLHDRPPTPEHPSERNARSRRFVSHHTINRIRKQATMQKELADMEKRMLQKNDENEHLRGKITKLEAQLYNDTLIEPNVEPKWVKYQKLYYSLLVCDPSGNPVTDSNGDFIPTHGKRSLHGACTPCSLTSPSSCRCRGIDSVVTAHIDWNALLMESSSPYESMNPTAWGRGCIKRQSNKYALTVQEPRPSIKSEKPSLQLALDSSNRSLQVYRPVLKFNPDVRLNRNTRSGMGWPSRSLSLSSYMAMRTMDGMIMVYFPLFGWLSGLC